MLRSKPMSKHTLILLILCLFLLTAYFAVKYFSISSPHHQFSLYNPKPTPVIESVIYFSPDQVTVHSGQKGSVDIIIDTKGNIPDLVQLEIAYDPSLFQNIDITPGDFYSDPSVPLKLINPNNGRISYVLEASDKNIEKNKGVLAAITFTPVSSPVKNETSLYFLPKTMVRIQNSLNTLKVAYGTKIQFIPGNQPNPSLTSGF